MKRVIPIVIAGLVGGLYGAATWADDATYGAPNVRSYVGAPLIADLDVIAPGGVIAGIPCVKVIKAEATQGSMARDVITSGNIAITRTDVRSVVQIRSVDIVRASPVLLVLETGCTAPKRSEYILTVDEAPAPVASAAPVATTPTKSHKRAAQPTGSSHAGTSTTTARASSTFDAQIVLDRVRDMPRLPSTAVPQ